jgi:hypothetical protein
MKKDEDRYLRTTSFSMATFLFAKGFQITGINPTGDGDQREFVFVRTDLLDELADLYRFGPKDDERLAIQVSR